MQIGHPAVAEVLAGSGFKWIVVDIEHSDIGLSTMTNIFRAMDKQSCVPLARVRDNDCLAIRQVLDMGARGVIVPLVNTADQARQAVASALYPPAGKRGFAFCRSNEWGINFDASVAKANQDIAVLVMIESKQGVENIDEILAVEGLDGVLIGPYDLSGSYGVVGQLQHPTVTQAIERIISAAHRLKKAVGLHVVNTHSEAIDHAMASGFNFLVLGMDDVFIHQGARDVIKTVNQKLKE